MPQDESHHHLAARVRRELPVEAAEGGVPGGVDHRASVRHGQVGGVHPTEGVGREADRVVQVLAVLQPTAPRRPM